MDDLAPPPSAVMKRSDLPLRILAVDDEPANLELLPALLEGLDVAVLTAPGGTEALAIAEVEDVDLAILDVRMAGMDGFELAERLRSSPRTSRLPILFLTAEGREERQMHGYELGAVDFIVKPVEPLVLQAKVRALLSLKRQAKELEDSLRLNELFVAVLAHDLRDPLSATMVGVDLLRRAPDTTTSTIAKRMLGSLQRMAAMIDQLADLSRARLGGGIPLTRTPTDLHEIVARTVEELRVANPSRRVVVRASGSLGGHWDEHRIEQVVSNLVSNAIHHGVPAAEVEVGLDGGQHAVHLTVANPGQIPADRFGTIFDPFRSFDSTAKRRGGLGLGLYIVQQIVDAHGGAIELRSRDGVTRFEVTLPREPVGAGLRKG